MNENGNVRLSEEQNEQIPVIHKKTSINLAFIALITSALAIILGILIFVFVFIGNSELKLMVENQNSSNKKEIESLKNDRSSIEKEIESLKNDNSNIEKEIASLNNDNPKIKSIETDVAAISFSLFCSEGIVTDKFVVQKADFYVFDGSLKGVIDIRGQPTYLQYFKGSGNFSLSDRKLRADLSELVDKLKTSLKSDILGILYKVKLGTISITQNNYDVATLKNGKIVLSGG